MRLGASSAPSPRTREVTSLDPRSFDAGRRSRAGGGAAHGAERAWKTAGPPKGENVFSLRRPSRFPLPGSSLCGNAGQAGRSRSYGSGTIAGTGCRGKNPCRGARGRGGPGSMTGLPMRGYAAVCLRSGGYSRMCVAGPIAGSGCRGAKPLPRGPGPRRTREHDGLTYGRGMLL